ncbi:tyrosine-type recombinase/integrase [Halocatena marina]|uniref:tyrosine-type recombinase/integrase n=1 Tax=Halocatena marina TaxID=2934937 RepID=UPI00200EED35|nr:site-specific integrase [Halocatena marina]
MSDQPLAPPIETAIDAFLQDKGKGVTGESGTYRSDAARELDRFVEWLREEDLGRTPTFADFDERTFRRYARFLVGLGNAKATTITYYAYVSSFCGWAVDEGYLERHYASTSVAHAPLPANDERRSGDQQAWDPEHRDRITRYVDEQADAAIDARSNETEENDGSVYQSIQACRDRALVYVLAYTAVRGAEIFRVPDDERRDGLSWRDVDLDAQSLTVFRKKQQWDEASIPAPVIHPLRIYKRILDPPDEDWPVFSTFHYPTLGRLVREELAVEGYSEQEIEEIRDEHERDLLVCREYGLGPPPSITPHAARSRMKRLCEEAEIVLDDRHGYLAPHGGRRGMGEVLVREFGYATAARYLDNSEQMVRERYSHIEAGEQADMATAALAASDQRVRDPSAIEEVND